MALNRKKRALCDLVDQPLDPLVRLGQLIEE